MVHLANLLQRNILDSSLSVVPRNYGARFVAGVTPHQENKMIDKVPLPIALVLVSCWIYSLFFVGIDIHQGGIYRILYIHVPSAFASFLSAAVLCLFSIVTLRKGKMRFLKNQHFDFASSYLLINTSKKE